MFVYSCHLDTLRIRTVKQLSEYMSQVLPHEPVCSVDRRILRDFLYASTKICIVYLRQVARGQDR
jgi:hypothetical protein